jgi:hypothetical protein
MDHLASKKALDELNKLYASVSEAKVEPPKEKLKTDRNMFNIPKDEQKAAKERLLAKAAAKRKAAMEALDPVGQEDADIDNDGDVDKSDKYLHKRRKAVGKAIAKKKGMKKEEVEVAEAEESKIGGGNLKKLAAKANKRIDADVDGDVDTKDPKSGEMGEFVPSPDGKKKVKTKVQKESYSNWRQDLIEIIDTGDMPKEKVKEKSVKNKIDINPTVKLESAIEEMGGTLLEVTEIDEIDYVVGSVYDELLEEGYDEDTIEEAIEYAIEASVTYGHDTDAPKRERKRDKLKSKAKEFLGKVSVKAYNKGRELKMRATPAAQRAKTSAKRGIRKMAQKVVDRMSEETVDEVYKGKHGQSDKEYADSRSQGGKMISGDSKRSGAEYTHGRRVKAANPGMQPDVGGKTKPKSQGKMDKGTRADLQYRKANLKKEEVEVEEGYKKIDQKKKNAMFRRAGNLSRDAISTPIPPDKRQDAHKKSGKIIKALNKANEEFEVEEGYDEPKMHSAVKRVMTTQPAAKGRAASRLHSKYSMRSKGNIAGETDGPGPNAPKRSGRKGRGAETDRGSGNAAKRRMNAEETVTERADMWHPDPKEDRKLGGPGANQRAREDRAAASKPAAKKEDPKKLRKGESYMDYAKRQKGGSSLSAKPKKKSLMGRLGLRKEEASDAMKDRRMERGGVGGNQRYDRAPKAPNTKKFGTGKTMAQKEMEKKYGKGKSAMDIVRAEIRAKHGKGSIK